MNKNSIEIKLFNYNFDVLIFRKVLLLLYIYINIYI